jgi:hypothetical protein
LLHRRRYGYIITSSSPLRLLLHRRHYGYYFIVAIMAITSSSPLWLYIITTHRHNWLYYFYSFIAISGYSITPSLPYLATVLLLHCYIWLQYYNFIAISGYNIKSTSLFNTLQYLVLKETRYQINSTPKHPLDSSHKTNL